MTATLAARKLVKHLGGQAALHRRLNAGKSPERISLEAIEKWCERDSIPGRWLAELLSLAKKDKIQIDVDDYIVKPKTEGFLCPACGSDDEGPRAFIEPSTSEGPWASVTETIVCGGCGRAIPAHLGERWEDLSAEDAAVEWQNKFKRRK